MKSYHIAAQTGLQLLHTFTELVMIWEALEVILKIKHFSNIPIQVFSLNGIFPIPLFYSETDEGGEIILTRFQKTNF